MNMYVSNLSFHTTDEDLKKLFEQFGAVSSAKVITRQGNRPQPWFWFCGNGRR